MKLQLKKEFFGNKETTIITHGAFSISAFRYNSGVEALRVENKQGHFIFLPFQGQQLWHVNFGGREISMVTTVKEPIPTQNLLDTYGCFMMHCGVSAFGAPQAEDNHPQHGELPNIPYQNAYVICDEDEKGKYIILGGVLDNNIAFTRHYQFIPECKIYEDGTVFQIYVTIENKKASPMEYMYLCHINFAPMEGAKLIYSAKRDKEHIKVHKIVPPMTKEKEDKLRAFMDRVQENPAIHDTIGVEGECYEPEIVYAVKYEGDENNRAYTLQYKQGQGACYVSHPIDALPVGVRWLSRTLDEDACGMVLPATAEHLGYTDSKRKGYVKSLAGGEKISFMIEAGYVSDEQAGKISAKIDEILK